MADRRPKMGGRVLPARGATLRTLAAASFPEVRAAPPEALRGAPVGRPRRRAVLGLAPAAAAALMAMLIIPVYFRRPRATAKGITALAGTIILSATTGAALAYTQRVSAPATHPLDAPLSEAELRAASSASQTGTIRLDGNVLIQPSNASITVPICLYVSRMRSRWGL